MICCTPSGYMIFSLSNLKFYEVREPRAGYEGRITQRPLHLQKTYYFKPI